MSDKSTPSDHAPELEPQLDAAVWSVISEPMDVEAIDRVKARAQNLAAEMHSPAQLTLPRVFATAPLATALAASILFMVGATMLMSTNSSAFGDVMEQLRSASALTFTTLIHTDRDIPIETRVLVAKNGRRRTETSGTVTVGDPSGDLRLTLIERTKKAIVSGQDEQVPASSFDVLGWFEALKSCGNQPYKRLGKKVMNGRHVTGFVAKPRIHEFMLWVDIKTNELVQVEHDALVEGSSIRKVVMKDFRFNEELSDSLFSYDVPAGYDVMKLPRSGFEMTNNEENIVEALRGYTTLADGQFPASITEWSEWIEVAVSHSNNGEFSQESTQVLERVGAILPFLVSMSKDDYEYVGVNRSVNDDRSIVFWYRAENGKIRAIYNDLTVAEVEATDLP